MKASALLATLVLGLFAAALAAEVQPATKETHYAIRNADLRARATPYPMGLFVGRAAPDGMRARMRGGAGNRA